MRFIVKISFWFLKVTDSMNRSGATVMTARMSLASASRIGTTR